MEKVKDRTSHLQNFNKYILIKFKLKKKRILIEDNKYNKIFAKLSTTLIVRTRYAREILIR